VCTPKGFTVGFDKERAFIDIVRKIVSPRLANLSITVCLSTYSKSARSAWMEQSESLNY
jgi:hypothetical protein